MKSILVVEDDTGISDAIKLILEADGYRVVLIPNANPIFKNNYEIPDLFILDKQLSGVDGLEVCVFLKKNEQTKHIPVIILSANHNILKLAIKAGADKALEKPFRMQNLKALVRECIAK